MNMLQKTVFSIMNILVIIWLENFIKSGYKFGRWYDMVWMEKYIGKHKEHPEAFIPFSIL